MENSTSSKSSENILNQPCSCGSGKKGGSCCMAQRNCSCGSEKPAGECCYKS